jgi:peptidoglycan/xylan/chitin deacetylase (PgdA/CDA1 family)
MLADRPGRSGPGALILMYHRVAEVPTDPHLLSVSPRHFAAQLEVVRQHARPARLAELEHALSRDAVPERAVALTCDDGYADSLLEAKPLLERHGIPATVFVTSGYVGSEGEFWWDELDRLMLQPGRLPERLRLAVDGRQYAWTLGEAARYSDAAFRQHRGWNVERPGDPTTRQQLYRALHALLKPLGETERRRTLTELRAWAGGSSSARPSHRLLSAEEVNSLARGGLVEVGAHSVTHALLPALAADEQREEIARSKRDLERILGRPVTRFAYPYGARAPEVVAHVREAGFTSACGGLGAVRNGTDPFQLPRVWVRDWDGDQFARRLSEWFLT